MVRIMIFLSSEGSFKARTEADFDQRDSHSHRFGSSNAIQSNKYSKRNFTSSKDCNVSMRDREIDHRDTIVSFTEC